MHLLLTAQIRQMTHGRTATQELALRCRAAQHATLVGSPGQKAA